MTILEYELSALKAEVSPTGFVVVMFHIFLFEAIVFSSSRVIPVVGHGIWGFFLPLLL